MIAPRKIAEEAVALAEKATRLEWHVGKGGEIVQRGNPYTLPGVICTVSDPEHPSAKADAALIAHAGTHYGTLARAYLALLPPAGAWSHDEGDVVLTHPDGSTERFYAGERAPFIVAACSRYEALVSDLPVVIEAAERDAQLAEDEAFYERDDPGGDVDRLAKAEGT